MTPFGLNTRHAVRFPFRCLFLLILTRAKSSVTTFKICFPTAKPYYPVSNLPSLHPFDLLAAVGRDCVGALQFYPINEPVPSIEAVTGTPVTDTDIEQLLQSSQEMPLGMSETNNFRISIAGAQEKNCSAELPKPLDDSFRNYTNHSHPETSHRHSYGDQSHRLFTIL